MRKFFAPLALIAGMAGLAFGDPLLLTKFDKDTKTATFKDGDKEVVAKLTDKTKVKSTDKDGGAPKDETIDAVTKRWSNEKALNKKFNVVVKDGEVTDVTLIRKKKK